ncbi:MAG TPA: DUF5131 family protein [Chloroflexi bacterium]|nr:DUF5131 family protein [Chloroflexota bacterium]
MKYWSDSHNSAFGCTRCSPGCSECWAEKTCARMAESPATAKLTEAAVHKGMWTGAVVCHQDRIPMKLDRTPRAVVFAMCWLTDLFHRRVPSNFIRAQLLEVNRQARVRWAAGRPPHRYLFLTRRYERMAYEVSNLLVDVRDIPGALFGATCCTAAELVEADAALAHLNAPRWLSLEPLMSDPEMRLVGTVDWKWLVLGGQSNGRPLALSHARQVRDWCIETETPLLFKQHGGRNREQPPTIDGETFLFTPDGSLVLVDPKGADAPAGITGKWSWS